MPRRLLPFIEAKVVYWKIKPNEFRDVREKDVAYIGLMKLNEIHSFATKSWGQIKKELHQQLPEILKRKGFDDDRIRSR